MRLEEYSTRLRNVLVCCSGVFMLLSPVFTKDVNEHLQHHQSKAHLSLSQGSIPAGCVPSASLVPCGGVLFCPTHPGYRPPFPGCRSLPLDTDLLPRGIAPVGRLPSQREQTGVETLP